MASAKQTSFTLGEVSPSLQGVSDSEYYAKALKKCRNFIVHPEGGVSNRAGTEHVGRIPTENRDLHPRLIPFHFSTGENYMLVFSHYEIRIIKDGEFLMDGGSQYAISSPYSWSRIRDIDYAQSGDMLILAHGEVVPRTLTRYGELDWRLEGFPWDNGPYAPKDPELADVKIKVVIDGDVADIYCDEDIFSIYMLGLPFSFGAESPEDPSIVEWGYGTVLHYYDQGHIQLTLEENPFDDYVLNGEFEDGLDGWREKTGLVLNAGSGVEPGVISTEASGKVRFGSQYCELQQSIDGISPNTTYRVTALWDVLSTEFTSNLAVYLDEDSSHRYFIYPDANTQVIPNCIGYATASSAVVANGIKASFTFMLEELPTAIWLHLNNDTYVDTGQTLPSELPLNYNALVRINSLVISVAEYRTTHWRLPAWCPGGAGLDVRGFPKHIEFYEQRLCWANTDNYPQGIWMSRTGNFYDYSFHTPFQEDDAIYYQLASRRIDPITWMEAANELIIGTASTVWRMAAGENTQVITPYSVTCRIQHADGCSTLHPVNVLGKILYQQRGKKGVRDLTYSWERDKFMGFDLCYHSKHMFEDQPIVSWDYEGGDRSIVWCVLNFGCVAALTYFPEQEIYAWHHHRSDNGEFLDVAVLHHEDGDEVYFIVWTYSEPAGVGQYNYDVVRMKPRIQLGHYNSWNIENKSFSKEEISRIEIEGYGAPGTTYFSPDYNYWFLDNAVGVYSEEPATSLSGLEHIAGRTVNVLADGALYPGIEVPDSGVITIGRASNLIIAGIPIEGEIVTLPVNPRSKGTRRMVVNTAKIHFERTRSAYVSLGDDNSQLEEVKFRDFEDGQNPIALRSGLYTVQIPTGWGDHTCLKIKAMDPVPTTILSIDLEVEAGER